MTDRTRVGVFFTERSPLHCLCELIPDPSPFPVGVIAGQHTSYKQSESYSRKLFNVQDFDWKNAAECPFGNKYNWDMSHYVV